MVTTVHCFVCNCAVKHSLTYFLTASSGLQTFPEFDAVLVFDGVQVGHCDSISKRAEPRQDWVKKLNEDKPENVEWHTRTCISTHQFSKAITEKIQQHFNQTGGHVLIQVDEDYGVDWTGPHNHIIPEIQLPRGLNEQELAALPNPNVPLSQALQVYFETVPVLKHMFDRTL